MKKNIILIFLSIFIISCNSSRNDMTLEEKKSLVSYINNVLVKKKHIKEGRNFIFYIIIRDCYCVEENINFIKKNIETFEKANVIILVKTSNKFNETFLDFISKIELHNTILINDLENNFEKQGNLYSTDKLLIIEDQKILSKLEFKKENFHEILSNLKSESVR